MTKKEKKTAAKNWLKMDVKKGDRIYAILRHVSKSGMLRVVDLYAIKHNSPVWLSGNVAILLEDTVDKKHGGIKVPGVGFDAAHHLVSWLSYELFKNERHLRHSWL